MKRKTRKKEEIKEMLKTIDLDKHLHLSNYKGTCRRLEAFGYTQKRSSFYEIIKGLKFIELLKDLTASFYREALDISTIDYETEYNRFMDSNFEDIYRAVKKIDKYFHFGWFNHR